MSKVLWVFAIFLCFGVTGCKSEQKIESVPVSEIPVSNPPQEEAKPEPVQVNDDMGIRMADSEHRIYGMVFPLGSIEISASESETRIYAPGMDKAAIRRFIDKYYPYQESQYFFQSDIFEVYSKLKPAYEGDNIVPDLNPNVFKPDTPVYIQIWFDKTKQHYEWIYRDPDYDRRMKEQAEAERCPSCGKNEPEPERELPPDEMAKICDLCRQEIGAMDEKTKAMCAKCPQ